MNIDQSEIEKQINIVVQNNGGNGEPVRVEVRHFHYFENDTPLPSAPPRDAVASSSDLLRDRSSVQLCVDESGLNREGSQGCYLGVLPDGSVVTNVADSNPGSIFQIKARGRSVEEMQFVSLMSTVGKYIRINADGSVDAGGGGGRWTLLEVQEMNSGLALKSVKNQGKPNVSGGTDWYLGQQDEKVRGDLSPFCFLVKVVEEGGGSEKHEPQHHRHHHHQRGNRNDNNAWTREEKLAAKEARRAEREAEKEKRRKEKELMKGWTDIEKNNPGKARAKGNTMPSGSVPKVVPATAEVEEFRGLLTLSPLQFANMQNRKGSVGWHLGCAPSGFLVPDAAPKASWSQWNVLETKGGNVILEASHTDSFHLAITKDGLITHKGGKGKFAQFKAEKTGKFWQLRSDGFDEPLFLAVSSSGVIYAAKKESRDTKFVANRVATLAHTHTNPISK